jgi:hypothetical protein
MINPELKVGDRIILWNMTDEISVKPGTKGTVTNIIDDPFQDDNKIISVKWDNGSTLALLSQMDMWKLDKTKIKESFDNGDRNIQFLIDNRDLKKTMDLNYFRDYFKLLRDTGITNMHGASPFVYMTAKHLERYYGENREDDENFQKLLEKQDEARAKFLSGLVKFANKTNVDLSDDSNINSLARRLAIKVLQFYMLFY